MTKVLFMICYLLCNALSVCNMMYIIITFYRYFTCVYYFCMCLKLKLELYNICLKKAFVWIFEYRCCEVNESSERLHLMYGVKDWGFFVCFFVFYNLRSISKWKFLYVSMLIWFHLQFDTSYMLFFFQTCLTEDSWSFCHFPR